MNKEQQLLLRTQKLFDQLTEKINSFVEGTLNQNFSSQHEKQRTKARIWFPYGVMSYESWINSRRR